MDHSTALATLSSDTKNQLQHRSDVAGMLHLVGHVTAIFLCSGYIIAQLPFWYLMMLPQGVLLVFLFTLSHECTHFTPFKTRWINNAVGHVVSLPLILPFTWFRYFHLAHHKHTNDPDNDPELEHGPRPNSRKGMLLYLSGLGYWRAMVTTLIQNALGQIHAPYLPERKHGAIKREARILLGLYVLIGLSLILSPLALTLWLVPILIGQPFLRLYLLAEHGLCPPVANMLENTRTTFTNRVIRALAWNMPYHAEHHSAPNVPFHQLPALHDHLRDHLKSTSNGYSEFSRDYIRTLD
jgi:fatty acid desaturase